ncbi:MAG: hypothetical protein A2144_10960 [Chloroflexi bacterium RBG_16_50_9]|nr:MAG: hypothetical protein A2144_10960 [Chloroflexi bacterium RBG_16_50_9]
MKKMDLMITGVGGQGVVLASDIIGESALSAGYDVKKTDTIGMAQRGGSVVSHLRIAAKVWSPLVKEGEADLLLGFEKLEAARWSPFLRPGGVAIVNNYEQPPLSVSLGKERYPGQKEITDILSKFTDRIYIIDATRRAQELGNIRTVNMFLLGCVSVFVPLKVSLWKDGISQRLPADLRKINLTAFDLGRKEIKNVNIR